LLTLSWRSPSSSFSRARGVPPSRLPTPPRCPQAPPPMTRQQAPPRPPRVLGPRPPPRPVVMGVEDSTSRGLHAPRRSPPLPPPPTMSSPAPADGRDPATHTAGTPHHTAPGVPAVGAFSPSRVPLAPVPAAAWHGRPIEPEALAGPTARRARSPATDKEP
jgi:hypothetical protein